MAEVQPSRELAPDQSSDKDDNVRLEQEETSISTMETSSIHCLPPSYRRNLSWPGSLRDSQAESPVTTITIDQDQSEDEDDDSTDDEADESTPRANTTRTHFVFTTTTDSSPSAPPTLPTLPQKASSFSLRDASPSWLQQAKAFPPPPLFSSSSSATISTPTAATAAIVSPTAQAQLKATLVQQRHRQAIAAVTTTTSSSEGTLGSGAAGVGAAQLPISAPFIYQLAAPAGQPVGGIRQSVLTPIFTFLPNAAAAQGLVAPSRPPVILSPPAAQALNVPLAAVSSPMPSILSNLAKVTSNGVGSHHQKSFLELGLTGQAHVLSTEPTTGQQTLKSPVMDCVTSTAVCRNPSPPRTLASIPLSEMTPQYSELKAFAEEFKNKRIRLGFTQGAVGQSLADKGYSNFAQSTISRFEQMQLSPTNAAAIKLVLEKWLQETENPESAHSPSTSSPVMASRKRKRRAVFTPQTKTTLENYFKQNPRPNRHVIESVAQELELLPEEVRVWFCNKRQKEKQGGPVSSSAVQVTAYSYPSYDRESSVSLSSSGANSPSSLYESSSVCQKRNSPSPPRNATPFTIEELSKSSSLSTRTISSPMCIANPFAASPQGVVMALTTPRISLSAQPPTAAVPQTKILLPQLQVAQTTA